nr:MULTISPECIES: ABC transporter substrate-binding protein [unclassified Achromobacter]
MGSMISRSRFSMLRICAALAFAGTLATALPAARAATPATTITAVMQSDIRVLDPIITTAYITRNFGYMIFDTLLGTDVDGKIHPQMLEKWDVSADGKTYTFTLRPGLTWQDGAPVTAADCVASIKRWATQDKMGQIMTQLMTGMQAIDANHFSMSFSAPTDLAIRALAKTSGVPPFMMPERIAKTPATEAIKEYIGSGPFKMVTAEFKPGVQIVFEKNQDYVPRSEPPSGTAGGKVVKVDRVKWVTMPDPMTAVNALASGEIDYMEQVPYDMLPLVENQPDVKLDVLDPTGNQTVMRMNFLNPPFDNKLVRQAAMYAVDQKEVLQALVGNPKYYRTCPAIFGCGMPYESDAGADVTVKGNIEKAKALLKEAHYDPKTQPVTILQPTDLGTVKAQPIIIAQALRKAGFNVKLEAMDWQTLVTRRASMAPLDKGGWNIFSTNNVMADVIDPLRAFGVAANGKGAWFGWPDVPAIEKLRMQFALAGNADEQRKLATQIQQMVIDEGVLLPMGQFTVPTGYRSTLSKPVSGPISVFWGISKSAN